MSTMIEQDILGFQVAMDDVLVFVEFEGVQDLNGEAADEAHADPSELGVFDEFVKVDAQKLEDEADVRAKNEVIFDLDKGGGASASPSWSRQKLLVLDMAIKLC